MLRGEEVRIRISLSEVHGGTGVCKVSYSRALTGVNYCAGWGRSEQSFESICNDADMYS